MTARHSTSTPNRTQLSKVPEVTAYFWIIKVLCTTVGETAADFLNVDLGLGLSGTSVATGILLAAVLLGQFRASGYVPGLYWSAVTLVSVFGTLVTDNLTDNLGVPLEASTVVFGVVLAAVFGAWYASERTLSIHSITTARRECFYWLAILFTFALGTATGDLISEKLSLGYLVSAVIVAAVIAATAAAWRLGLHPVLAFWIIYILTRPLGASLGDLLAQPPDQGGLGLGTTTTSVIFLGAILAIVAYLSITRADVIARDDSGDPDPTAASDARERWRFGSGLVQTVAAVALLLVLGSIGYTWRTAELRATSPAVDTADGAALAAPGASGPPAAGPYAALGDLSTFRAITTDTLARLNAGDQSGATSRVTDLETAWDQAQGRLQARDEPAWTRIGGKIDSVLQELRAGTPDPNNERAALTALLSELG